MQFADRLQTTHYGHSYAATDEFLGLEPPVAHQVLQAAEIDNSLSLIVSAHDAVQTPADHAAAVRSTTQSMRLPPRTYGYFNCIQSSRRLEREVQRNLELIWLTGPFRLGRDSPTSPSSSTSTHG